MKEQELKIIELILRADEVIIKAQQKYIEMLETDY